MNGVELTLTGAEVLLPGGPARRDLCLSGGQVVDAPAGRQVDLSGYLVLPGIVDLHGDGFERHMAPRRGAMKEMGEGVVAAEAELAANGITTAVLAQFWSWEGGLRGPDFAAGVFQAIRQVQGSLVTDLIPQLRFETHLLEDYAALPDRLAEWQVPYVVFNDHLPHDRLAEGRKPPRLAGQALKAGRSPEAHLALLQALHANGPQVPAALDKLCAELHRRGVRMGSHDDHSAEDCATGQGRGLTISEFPETLEAAEATRASGGHVILGSPNVVRGGSHKGNVSALDLITMGLCDALASDYHYPSPRRAALMLVRTGLLDLAAAWALVSSGPARVLGLDDRGELAPGKRADLVILDAQSHRVAATFAAGRVSYMSGDVATRFLA
ncbi:alpha-D-ribose 1-methylphosphonate 5-triphosphate diphosphatase [Ruegeria pomeroyi]|uniref:Alkylphosphonate utilization protein PhnM, putative n=2 Tax=Ruegeria pomeroyi TaxID=89184 RepID=Q5LV11_RUEPO|nr:alpha-D-ribose 1-methylphosphonate 5-triphosphate diphosphatase [Ruegeria pomeroyi]AAV94196.1 alkylphosphonate utilization protein PhnM, putative [Ruegeria pomeroyi DSS-3]NVK97775.1 alpha-D-ribose 1-methylphosphonate 5-triphosphate diphosphatase [Ruegeria pomeroyi]NVL02878.1 alpha-D-ribose 1-methylphosphonate 5-triphosphate diphosphatase [Ruegeria pomeroyi]QWV07771.1 alpha-D-ribose 1-methylphosphonate 5-triphosphate diphosphatase [Ruegeria pomeroyi]